MSVPDTPTLAPPDGSAQSWVPGMRFANRPWCSAGTAPGEGRPTSIPPTSPPLPSGVSSTAAQFPPPPVTREHCVLDKNQK